MIKKVVDMDEYPRCLCGRRVAREGQECEACYRWLFSKTTNDERVKIINLVSIIRTAGHAAGIADASQQWEKMREYEADADKADIELKALLGFWL
jgi:hypothetical protein